MTLEFERFRVIRSEEVDGAASQARRHSPKIHNVIILYIGHSSKPIFKHEQLLETQDEQLNIKIIDYVPSPFSFRSHEGHSI